MNASTPDDRRLWLYTGAASALALGFLGWLLYGRQGVAPGAVDLRFLPAVNASLNALTATLLVGGYVAVKSGRKQLHRYLMVAVFLTAALFLVGYIAYHAAHGETKYTGQGALRVAYFSVLASHVVLSMLTLPLALAALALALTRRFARHKQVTRWLFPMWLYVSVSGVAVFFLLQGMPTAR